SCGRGEGANVGHQAAHLLLADLPALGRHVRSLAVEDARHQLGVGPLLLPGGNGKVGDLRQEAAGPAPCAVCLVALYTALPEKLAYRGVPSATGADSWATLCCPDSDGFDRAPPGETWDSSRYWRRNS